jgi:hypothetical protein
LTVPFGTVVRLSARTARAHAINGTSRFDGRTRECGGGLRGDLQIAGEEEFKNAADAVELSAQGAEHPAKVPGAKGLRQPIQVEQLVVVEVVQPDEVPEALGGR